MVGRWDRVLRRRRGYPEFRRGGAPRLPTCPRRPSGWRSPQATDGGAVEAPASGGYLVQEGRRHSVVLEVEALALAGAASRQGVVADGRGTFAGDAGASRGSFVDASIC